MDDMYHEITPEVQERIDGLIENYEHAALATMDERFPLISKVMPVVDDGEIYLLMSDLSEHTRHIRTHSKRVCLYFAHSEGHTSRMNNPRYSIMGKLYPAPFTNDKRSEMFQKLLKKFDVVSKGAKMYGMFHDFHIYRFEKYEQLYIEGFGKAYK